MDEPRKPKKPQDPQARRIVLRFALGAAPALIGILLPLSHTRSTLVAERHEVVFIGACLALVALSLAIGLYYALERITQHICSHFDQRHNELMAEFRALQGQLQNFSENEANRHEESNADVAKMRKSQRAGHERLKRIERQVLALGDAFVRVGPPASRRSARSEIT